MRNLMALAVLVLLAGCVSGPAVGSIVKYNTSSIVFVSKAESPVGELYLVNATGQIRRLTFNDRMENNPAFSPDHKKIAFHAGNASDYLSWEVFIMDLETGKETQITHNRLLDGHPDWSPDGTKLIYASFQDSHGRPAGTGDLFVVDILTNKTWRLTNNKWENNDPEWSPDGTKIIFKSTRDTEEEGKENMYVMDWDGSNVRRLTSTKGWVSDHDASWKYDSRSVVFERYDTGKFKWSLVSNITYLIQHINEFLPWNIYSVDLQGNLTKLTNTNGIAFLPVYSPDNRIMYIEMEPIFRDGKFLGFYKRLVTMNSDGSNKTRPFPDEWYGKHIYELEYFDW